jgi:hypothetical protein
MSGRFDWEAIKRDYELDRWSNRELATKYGCSHVAIGKRASKEGWTKRLGNKVRDRTAELLAIDDALTGEEKDLVEAQALKNQEVIRAHKAELREAGEDQKGLAQVGRTYLKKVLEQGWAPSSEQLKVLASYHESLIRSKARIQAMERKAYGLDVKDPDENPDEIGLVSEDELVDAIGELLARADRTNAPGSDQGPTG